MLGQAMKDTGTVIQKLKVLYDPETDTLSLWNGRPVCEGEEVGEGLIADYDIDGQVVGITLDGAMKLLFPYLYEAMKAKAED